jgi:TRAP transporter TAXI family solute receptor
MMTKSLLSGLGLIIFSLIFQATILPPANVYADVKQLSMGTATVGGIFYNIGGPLVQCVNKALPEVNITAEFTQGSTENLRLIKQKKMQLAIITPMIGSFARKGIKMFKKSGAIDFRVVVRLLPNANIWATLKGSDAKRIPDLKGRKVGVGPASGGLGVVARAQLKANGLNFKKDLKPYFLGAGAMAEALKDGTVEGTILTAELAKQVAMTHPLNPLPWDEATVNKFLKENPHFGRYVYPPDTFKGVDYSILTVDNGIQMIVQTDMDEKLVYKLAKAVIENIDCLAKIYAPAKALTPQWAASELANPFHPGAIRYFKDKGLLN